MALVTFQTILGTFPGEFDHCLQVGFFYIFVHVGRDIKFLSLNVVLVDILMSRPGASSCFGLAGTCLHALFPVAV